MIPYRYSLEDFYFVALSKQSRDPGEKQLLPVLADLQDGKRQADIALDMLKIGVPTVKRTLRRFKKSPALTIKKVTEKISASAVSVNSRSFAGGLHSLSYETALIPINFYSHLSIKETKSIES